MSLNNIILPPSLLADLYRHSLVDGTIKPANAIASVPSLGGNKKNILIVTHHIKQAFLPDKELDFLTTVLSACGLGLNDVAIVNATSFEKGADVTRLFAPKEILLLDVLPDGVNLSGGVAEYTVMEAGGLRYVCAPSLTEIEKTKQTKSKLWTALKQLFCLS